MSRRSGILIPLFSVPSDTSWGIGDIGDLRHVASWLSAAGQRVLQLLPINEMAPGQQSPYSAISAMAIDPIYLDVAAIPEFAAAGGVTTLSSEELAALERVRTAPSVQYATIRRLKEHALRIAASRFVDSEIRRATPRAQSFARFLAEQGWWLNEYALFRALHAAEDERPWTAWPAPLRQREKPALADARYSLTSEVTFRQYVQWLAHTQWSEARAAASRAGVALFGDLPFMVDGDSADVWARQHQFHLDVSAGVPPDAFSETGQDWGMPVYRWEAIAEDGFDWLRERARRSADLFDGYRVDHLVGFYRTYGRPRDGRPPFFTPASERDQIALGEQLLKIFGGAGAEIIAEDLGVVPDFVRQSLSRLGVPGFRVFRWERHWHDAGQPFIDPADYPVVSVATSGTHDTETMTTWWEATSADERHQVAALPTMRRIAPDGVVERDALLQILMASASSLVLFPVQDVFGWRERINEPATVNEINWTFRLPWPSNRLDDFALERKLALRAWAEQHRRL
ncbi:MAG TPA: 4-alpha-glucanotransferase [Vicinamibacterales bacterium]|nr:4-alpha-glucanotransferase [Vicinamibacterales bacterium]